MTPLDRTLRFLELDAALGLSASELAAEIGRSDRSVDAYRMQTTAPPAVVVAAMNRLLEVKLQQLAELAGCAIIRIPTGTRPGQ